jgi:hypothetical protein
VTIDHFPTRWGDRTYRRFRYDPAETGKLGQVVQLQVETTRIYESPTRVARGRLERWMRRAIDRVTPAP